MIVIILFFLFLLGEVMNAQDAPSEKDISYRPATVAGSFYPANSDTLKKDLAEYLELDKPRIIPPEEKNHWNCFTSRRLCL